MPHPSSLVCKTAAPASPPAVEPPSPPPAAKHRGNPNLALVPRCGARTRAGCPCRAPAISGKLRCRMHGGRSTGPRTAEGMARLRAARTTHGGYSADSRAFNRHHVTFMRRGRVRLAAVLYLDRLPPDLAARMTPIAPELLWPPRPTRGITRAEDRILLQAETEALAPWKLAIAQARQARRAGRAGTAERCGALTAAQAGPLARNRLPLPLREGVGGRGSCSPNPSPQPPPTRGGGVSPVVPAAAQAGPHAPIRPTPTPAAPQQVPGSSGAPVVAKPYAPNRAARRASSASAPARLAARLAVRAKAHAPERAAGAAATALAAAPAAPASARTEPLAPIPPAPARGAPDEAPASVRAEPAAKPHAPEHAGRGPGSVPAPARLAAPPIPHAPEHAPTTQGGSRTISVGRAARRWRRQQKLMHRNQPAGARP